MPLPVASRGLRLLTTSCAPRRCLLAVRGDATPCRRLKVPFLEDPDSSHHIIMCTMILSHGGARGDANPQPPSQVLGCCLLAIQDSGSCSLTNYTNRAGRVCKSVGVSVGAAVCRRLPWLVAVAFCAPPPPPPRRPFSKIRWSPEDEHAHRVERSSRNEQDLSGRQGPEGYALGVECVVRQRGQVLGSS